MKNREFLVKNLIEIGLTENEAAVYFALLTLGQTTVLKVSKFTGIKRTTVYHTIDSLVEKGIARIEHAGLKKFYVAEDPTELKEVLENRTKNLEKLLPDLNSLHVNRGSQGTIKQFEGMRAIKNVYTKILSEVGRGEDYLVISDPSQWYELDPQFFQNFLEKRAKLNLKLRLLFTRSQKASELKHFERNYNMNVRLLPEKTNLPTNLIIIKNKVIIHRLSEPFRAIVMDDPLVIQMYKEMFEVMWGSVE